MNYKLYKVKENSNLIDYIIYENGKIIELTRNKQHKLIIDNNYIFLLFNYKLDKVFDINNKRFLTKQIEMKSLYNNYKDIKRKQKKKILNQ